MQEFLDDQELKIKKLSNFEPGKEKEYKSMSVYDFLFHILALDKHASDLEQNK